MNNETIVDELSVDELDDFSAIITNTIKEICMFADKHNFDRNNMFQYLANRLTIISEVSNIENYNVSPKTNADKIRNMSDKELLDFIYDVSGNCTEVTICQGKCVDCLLGEKFCKNGYRKWLQKKVEE